VLRSIVRRTPLALPVEQFVERTAAAEAAKRAGRSNRPVLFNSVISITLSNSPLPEGTRMADKKLTAAERFRRSSCGTFSVTLE
jgi:hypothetical protein